MYASIGHFLPVHPLLLYFLQLLTWRRLSLARRSKTLLALLSGRRAAFHPHWLAAGRPPQHLSSGRSARTGNGRFLRTTRDTLGSIPDPRGQGWPGNKELGGKEGHKKRKTEIIKERNEESADLLPQRGLRCQTGNGGHHPAVTQTALVQVTSADAVHKQTRVLTDLLDWVRGKRWS